jgi:beta-N-acetylhexosaminidase
MVLLCNQSVDGGAAVDELLDGLQATLDKAWQASEVSNQRRIALLPQAPCAMWDELMTQPHYVYCLDIVSQI